MNNTRRKRGEAMENAITRIGLLMALPYLLAMTILQFIFGRFN